jgi:hypothetical protein
LRNGVMRKINVIISEYRNGNYFKHKKPFLFRLFCPKQEKTRLK